MGAGAGSHGRRGLGLAADDRSPSNRPLSILAGAWAISSWFGSISPPSCLAAAFAPQSASA